MLELNGTDQQIGSLSGAAGSYVDLGGATLTVSGGGTTTFAGTIYGTGGFTYSGGGTLILSGADTHTGTTTVTSGWLQAGATDALSANTAYIVTSGGALEIGGDQTIASLSGDGGVTGSGTLTVGGNGTSTTFCGTLGDSSNSSPLSLDKIGDGTLILSGGNTYSGPTTIEAGTLQVDDYVNDSPVTIDSGATLTGDGGTSTVTNLGGTYDATLYNVTITNARLQNGSGNASNILGLFYAPGQNGLILGLSEADAVYRVLKVSTTADSDVFEYNPNYTLGLDDVGQAYVDKGPGDGSPDPHEASPASLTLSTAGDYFPISVTQDTSDPIAVAHNYQDGVGGYLEVSPGSGLLAGATDQTSGTTLSISSYTDPSNGTLTVNESTGALSYTPNTGFFGTDTFTYIAYDGDGNQSNTATATIQVLLPQIDLLDDANNDGVINSADEPVKDIGTGENVLVSNDSGYSNADANHLDQLNITALDSLFESLPSGLSGWTLDLDVVGGAGGVAKIWSSLDKTTELDTDGNMSWDLSNVDSIPSSVYLELTTAGTFELDLALYAPSAISPAAKSQVRVTSTDGRLIAQQISDNAAIGGLPSNIQQASATACLSTMRISTTRKTHLTTLSRTRTRPGR